MSDYLECYNRFLKCAKRLTLLTQYRKQAQVKMEGTS